MSKYQRRVFGQYTLLERIASGGMAEIFLAKTKGFGGFEKTLVIKRLHPHYSDDHSFVKMLVDEAKITVQLQHANIVQIFDLGRIGGQYYIAMEYVDGKDLFHILRELHDNDLQMPLEAACFIAAQLCHGLQYAHCRRDEESNQPLQVVHRDISPQNLLVSWSGEVKIADFGIVKAAQRSTHTEAGIIKGKFYYMSPEQALGIDIDYRSDIFSAGIVLFEALTATPLYDDTETATLMQRVQSGDVRSPTEFRDDIPEELDRICMRALAADRDARYGSALEMGRDLSNFLVSRGRAFTKVDLGDFLRSLFRDHTVTDPEMRGPTGEETAQIDLLEVPGTTGPMAAPRNAPTIADMPAPSLSEPTVNDRPMPQPPPLPPTRNPVLELEPTQPPTRFPTPFAAAAAAGDNAPTDPEQPNLSDISSPDAMTTRLSVEEIRRVNERMLAASQPMIEALKSDPAMMAPTQDTAAAASRLPMPVRKARARQANRRRKRDRALKVALGVVAAAILAVSTAIVWLLLNPVTLPPLPEQPAAVVKQAPQPRVRAAQKAERPRRTEPRDETEVRSDVDDEPEDTSAASARVTIALTEAGQLYKLYVDGELAEVRENSVVVPAGRHTIQARLLPQGTLTRKRVVELGPGTHAKVKL